MSLRRDDYSITWDLLSKSDPDILPMRIDKMRAIHKLETQYSTPTISYPINGNCHLISRGYLSIQTGYSQKQQPVHQPPKYLPSTATLPSALAIKLRIRFEVSNRQIIVFVFKEVNFCLCLSPSKPFGRVMSPMRKLGNRAIALS